MKQGAYSSPAVNAEIWVAARQNPAALKLAPMALQADAELRRLGGAKK